MTLSSSRELNSHSSNEQSAGPTALPETAVSHAWKSNFSLEWHSGRHWKTAQHTSLPALKPECVSNSLLLQKSPPRPCRNHPRHPVNGARSIDGLPTAGSGCISEGRAQRFHELFLQPIGAGLWSLQQPIRGRKVLGDALEGLVVSPEPSKQVWHDAGGDQGALAREGIRVTHFLSGQSLPSCRGRCCPQPPVRPKSPW